jgi:hypothetical protein
MNTVSIAEQKAKDSVGKENGMNLSDHESSESDGEYNSAKEICKYPLFLKVGGNYPLDLKIIWSSDLYNPHHWLHSLHFHKFHFPSTLKISSSLIDLH